MKRRTLLVAAGVALAGCTTTSPDEDSGETEAGAENESDPENDAQRDENEDDEDDSESESETEERTDEEIIEQFRVALEDAGFERVDTEHTDDSLGLSYDATGTGESDVATEIELITDGYTTTVEEGLSLVYLEASAYDPNDGDVLDSFAIETELVDAYLSGSLEWHELLTRVADTFVSYDREDEAESNDEDETEDEGGTEEGAEDETSEERTGNDAETEGGENEEGNDSGTDEEVESDEDGNEEGR